MTKGDEQMTYDQERLAKRIVKGTSEETQEYAAHFGVSKPADPAEPLPKAQRAKKTTPVPQVVAGSISKVRLGDLLEKALKG